MAMAFDNHKLTGVILSAVIHVHQVLGPGFLEKIYRRALLIELRKRGLKVEVEKHVIINYEGQVIGRHILDLIVEDRVVIELKTVETLSKAHYAQLRSYLKASSLTAGLLINFAGERADFRRVQL